jgi:hypothetical protein
LEEINCDDDNDVEELKFGVKVKMITKAPKIKLIVNKLKEVKEKKKENIVIKEEEEENITRMTCLLEENESFYKENYTKLNEQIAMMIDSCEETGNLRNYLVFIDSSKLNLVLEALMYSCFSKQVIVGVLMEWLKVFDIEIEERIKNFVINFMLRVL